MTIETENDFKQLQVQLAHWRKQFPMFSHDVKRIEKIIETHIRNYSIVMVQYRQTKSKSYIEKAQHEINEINRVLQTVSNLELIALLARG